MMSAGCASAWCCVCLLKRLQHQLLLKDPRSQAQRRNTPYQDVNIHTLQIHTNRDPLTHTHYTVCQGHSLTRKYPVWGLTDVLNIVWKGRLIQLWCSASCCCVGEVHLKINHSVSMENIQTSVVEKKKRSAVPPVVGEAAWYFTG